MYSKSKAIATCVLLALTLGCASKPWSKELIGEEVNLIFTLQNNLLFLPSAAIDGHPGRVFLSSANARSALDPRFVSSRSREHHVDLTEKEVVRFSPALVDLGGIGDAELGADVWGGSAISIDYHAGLISIQKHGIHPDGMIVSTFTGAPAVDVLVDGITVRAIVDTASPEALVLPRASRGRGTARLNVAGNDLGVTDILYADVDQPRIGNRTLSRFLVTIDYGRKQVGLWRDPRKP